MTFSPWKIRQTHRLRTQRAGHAHGALENRQFDDFAEIIVTARQPHRPNFIAAKSSFARGSGRRLGGADDRIEVAFGNCPRKKPA
jgi:hypothetical protein